MVKKLLIEKLEKKTAKQKNSAKINVDEI